MTYRAILASETAENAPVTQALMDALRQNEAAVASGATGAPRNRPLSLDLILGGSSFALSGTTPVNYVDLAGLGSLFVVGLVIGLGSPNESTAVNLEISYSTNNGSSWSAWQTVIVTAGESGASLTAHVNLTEGRLNARAPITGAAGANAVRFRTSNAGGSGRIMVYGMGRT
jgi:hypothetical protein